MILTAGIIKESVVDGPGIRYVIFTKGCPHRCLGCHNPETWFAAGGKPISYDDIVKDIENNPLLSGITISGGEPLVQAEKLIPILTKLRKDFPQLDIMSYSGYTYEEILGLEFGSEYLKCIDYLMDGRFVLSKRTVDAPFRGSSNQRFIRIVNGEMNQVI